MMSLAHIKPSVEPQACCFATGKWFFKAEIKVAHLIPNAMTADEIFYLIGNREDMLRDPQNGIPLHSAIGTAMDLEILVVVPKEPLGSNTWQMVLVDWFFENVRGKFFSALDPRGHSTEKGDVSKRRAVEKDRAKVGSLDKESSSGSTERLEGNKRLISIF